MVTDRIEKGIEYYNKGEYKKALTEFRRLSDTEKLKHYYLGITYTRLNNIDSALFHLKTFLKNSEVSFPILIKVLMILGYLHARKEEYKKAKSYFEKVLQLDFNNSKAYAALGYIYYKVGNIQEALNHLQKALEIDQGNATAHNSFGYILAENDLDIDKALKECQKALELKPDYPAYLDSIGWIYFKKGDYIKAKHYLTKALEKMPECNEIREHFRVIVRKELSFKKEQID